MTNDDRKVGYGNPPIHSRFKSGNKANPKGRPKRRRDPLAIAEIIDHVFNGRAEYQERGRTKKASRRELTIRSHIKLALAGDLKSIETILMLRESAQTSSDAGVRRLEIADWLPDYPGQTGEQKTREFAAQSTVEVPSWWKDAEFKSEDSDK